MSSCFAMMALIAAVGGTVGQPTPSEVALVKFAEADHLPLAFVVDLAPVLEIRRHDLDSLAPAYYSPASETEGSAKGPELMVKASHYLRADHHLAPAIELAPDAIDYLAHALLLAYFHLELTKDIGSELEQQLGARAAELYPELDQRSAIGRYVTSIAEFGAHVLSLANEIERMSQRVERSNLCGWLAQGHYQFGAWNFAVNEGEYFGLGAMSGKDGVPRRSISQADKLLLFEQVLETRWRGESQADFSARFGC